MNVNENILILLTEINLNINHFFIFYSTRMKLGMFYDQSFKAQFGADSVNAMRRVVAQVSFTKVK